MRITIGIKIFGIAVGLLILMAVVALLSMRMTRTVDDQLVIVDHNYFPDGVMRLFFPTCSPPPRSASPPTISKSAVLALASTATRLCW